jgi:leucyl-tRNA synthetase
VSEDYAALRNNTAAAKLIEYTNYLTKEGVNSRAAIEPLVLMVAPLAPHLAEELWQRLGHERLLVETAWPEADPAWTTADSVVVAVQVNGKRRAELELPLGCPREEAESRALADAAVRRAMAGKPPRRVVVVPDRIVNVVV